jgi:hypothetical protein
MRKLGIKRGLDPVFDLRFPGSRNDFLIRVLVLFFAVHFDMGIELRDQDCFSTAIDGTAGILDTAVIFRIQRQHGCNTGIVLDNEW